MLVLVNSQAVLEVVAAVLRGSKIEAAAVVEDGGGPDRVVERSGSGQGVR